MNKRSFLYVIALVIISIFFLNGCSQGAAENRGSAPVQKKIFNFTIPSKPLTLDPMMTTDTESLRVARQVLEPLVTANPINGNVEPGLAQSWHQSPDRLKTTFNLRDNVKFHDGTQLTAQSVCKNFDRWYKLPKKVRNNAAGFAFQNIFEAFSDQPKKTIYNGCEANDNKTVVLAMKAPYTPLLKALSQTSFAIMAPSSFDNSMTSPLPASATAADTSLRASAQAARNQIHKNDEKGTKKNIEGPIGTGAYIFSAWKKDDITLNKNENYWGKTHNVDIVKFQMIDTAYGRTHALTDEKARAIDYLNQSQYDTFLRQSNTGLRIQPRDPFSLTYLGINQDFPALSDPIVREAIAKAIDRNDLISSTFVPDSRKAMQFLPPRFTAYGENSGVSNTNIEEAKQLIEQSSYAGEPIPFYYPTNVAQAYLPEPAKTYAILSKQLSSIGLVIKPVPINWNDDYMGRLHDKNHGLFLTGLNGEFQDPDTFLGTLFSDTNAMFNYKNDELFTLIGKARQEEEQSKRIDYYGQAQKILEKDLPAIPLVFPISAVGLSSYVVNYPTNPVPSSGETINEVVLR